MSRKFRNTNYEETLNQTIRLGDALATNHLARYVVDLNAQLDLSQVYAHYATTAKPLRRKSCWGCLSYGFATGVFISSKAQESHQLEHPHALYCRQPVPVHDTIAQFRKTFLAQIKDLFVQFLLHRAGSGHFSPAASARLR